MAIFGWQKEKSIHDWLLAEGYRFDFFQAVRLLELSSPHLTPVGEGFEPDKEPVRFSARVGFDFPAGEVHELVASEAESTPLLITNFLGLAGVTGPLPPPLAELILERVRQKDLGMRDFLDIFNHRLISLMYRTRKIHRVTLSSRSPEQGPMANFLHAFMGLGLNTLRDRMGVPDRALLPYAGLLFQRPRSVAGLERVLSDHFRVNIKVQQFAGAWRDIESDQRTRLGKLGQNQILGQTAVVGSRIWDQQGCFCVVVGPLTLEEYLDFLPTEPAYRPLCELIRFYTGQQFDFRIRLKLKAAETPPLVLGKARLSWTSWLKKSTPLKDPEVELSGVS